MGKGRKIRVGKRSRGESKEREGEAGEGEGGLTPAREDSGSRRPPTALMCVLAPRGPTFYSRDWKEISFNSHKLVSRRRPPFAIWLLLLVKSHSCF